MAFTTTQSWRTAVKNRAAKDTYYLYFTNLLAAGISFAVSLVIARRLGPEAFGIITAYNSIIFTLSGFTDFGLGTGLIKFTSPLLKASSNKATAYFKAVFYAEIGAGLLVLIGGLSLSGFLSKLIGAELPHDVVVLAIIAASITSASAYVAASLAAHKLFKRNAIISSSISLLRMMLILALLILGQLSLQNVLFAYAALAFLNAFIGFAAIPKDFTNPTSKGEVRNASKELFKFSGWLTLTFLITSIMGRLDFFYLYNIKGASQAGVYAAAIQLSMIFTMLIGAISTVLTPYVSERINYRERIDILKKLMPAMFVLAAMLAVSSLAFPFIINLLFGAKYADAADPLTILLIHLAINVILIPITLMFIPLGKVRLGTYVSLIQLAIALVLYPVLIELYGSVGAALTILINSLVALLIYPTVLFYLLKKEKRRESR